MTREIDRRDPALNQTTPAHGATSDVAEPMGEQTREAFEDVRAAIRIHGEELVNNPNVVLVQPGYRFRGATFVREPVLSVTVLRKAQPADVPAGEQIPARLGKVSVDVVPATPLQQLAFFKRREEIARTGVAVPAGEISTVIPGEAGITEAVAAAEDESPLAPYVPPDKPLALVNEEMTVICHASPDAGWRNLRQFISETQERLTSTMYEFNARHILDAITNQMQEPRKMNLILDGGDQNTVPGPPATTISKLAARQTLANSLQNRFECVWAPVADDDLTTKSFFPRAYHTKVTVRDGNAFWLSSGNWKESGQPFLDPIEGPLPPGFDKSFFQSDHNREWHVIVKNRSLAETFEIYITHDIAQAKPIQIVHPGPPSDEPMPDLFIPAEGLAAFADFDSEPEFFREETFTKQVKVQPIMTPDNYPEMIMPLIQNAQRSLYFQNQTLSPSAFNQRYVPLFNSLRDKTKAAAINPQLDVKILVSEFTDFQKLIAAGFNLDCVKRQFQNHNKGIIIDDEIVIVGSHNWSGQGATQNRDASLIFFDAQIASYFKKLFLYDWNRITVSDSLMLAMPIVAAPGEAPPPGMIRVPWSSVFPESRAAAEME